MVSGSCACTSITKPKSVGRLPLTSRHESPASSERMTSQCFCMNSTPGRERCSAMRCTQWPTSAVGLGMYWERRPRLIGRQVLPASSVRKAPAAEMATCIRRGLLGSSRIVWRHIPPAPGCRSEEHTSELQSLAYLVCRLLLEKKKTYILELPRGGQFPYNTRSPAHSASVTAAIAFRH